MGTLNNIINASKLIPGESAAISTITDLLSTKYYINAVPTYQAMRCSDRKTNGEDCTVCSDICPQGIYPVGKRKRPVWTQCIKCGICAANCPDKCLTFPGARVDNFLMAVSKSGETGIGCAEDDSVMTLTVSCLAAVSWEQMAYAALSKGLVISRKACDKCEREGFKELIDDNIERLRFFLGDELFNKKVKILYEGDKYEPTDTGMSRRELFNIFKNLPLDKAMRIVPELESTQDNGLFYRAMLRDEILRSSEGVAVADRPKFRIKLPVFNENCYNCGTCVRTCPQKALKITQQDDKFLITIDAWRCTGCGICSRSCKVEGISGMATMKVSTLGKVALKRVPVYTCVNCGKPRHKDSEDGLCQFCISRRNNERLRAERQAKLAAEKAKKEAEKAAKEAEEAAAKAAAEAAAAVPEAVEAPAIEAPDTVKE